VTKTGDLDDTIAAISTPMGEGGIGIVRLSGKNSIQIADRFFKSKRGRLLEKMKSHTIHYGSAVHLNGEVADEVLVSVFRAPNSYTKENVVEISAHGGIVPLRQILNLAVHHGARMAEPGEFTKRAFLNGRIDLTQAEAVMDTIRAKTDLALRAAMNQLQGSVSKEINSVKDNLMKIYAHLEAFLDFPDEHLEVYSNQEFHDRYESAVKRVENLLQSFAKGEILREGVVIVIVGRPNVGKSSLLNALLERDRAIVSAIPGTTRDALEEMIQLGGIPIRLVDTAGLFSSTEPLTQASMERTRKYFSNGDLFLFLLDAETGATAEDRTILSELEGKRVIPIVNKIDLLPEFQSKIENSNAEDIQNLLKKHFVCQFDFKSFPHSCFISAKTGFGIQTLEKSITSLIWNGKVEVESNQITRFRHKQALEEALEALKKSREAFLAKESLEFVTLDLKCALDALREMVGEIYSEDLLDVIFKEFCIGK